MKLIRSHQTMKDVPTSELERWVFVYMISGLADKQCDQSLSFGEGRVSVVSSLPGLSGSTPLQLRACKCTTKVR